MNVGEACAREVFVVEPNESLQQAVSEMCRRNVGCIVVVERHGECVVPVGVITDRDVMRRLASTALPLTDLRVASVMSRDLLILKEDESVVDASQRMRDRRVRRAPVVAESGDLVGVVSTDDLLGIVAEQLTSLARLVEWQARSTRA